MEIMTDERLDWLAERFHVNGILSLCGIPFHKYILYPDNFDRMADKVRNQLAFPRLVFMGEVISTSN